MPTTPARGTRSGTDTRTDKFSGAEVPNPVVVDRPAILEGDGFRLPETGASEAPETVTLTGPHGTKVSAPERAAHALKAAGYK